MLQIQSKIDTKKSVIEVIIFNLGAGVKEKEKEMEGQRETKGMKGEERLRMMQFLKGILKAAIKKQLTAYQGASRLTADFLPETIGSEDCGITFKMWNKNLSTKIHICLRLKELRYCIESTI